MRSSGIARRAGPWLAGLWLTSAGCVAGGDGWSPPNRTPQPPAVSEIPARPPDADPTTDPTSVPEDPLTVPEGMTVSIRSSPCSVAPGGRVALAAAVTVGEDSPAALEAPITYRWSLPEGWRLEGEGADVVAIAPGGSGAASGEVGLEVRDGAQLVATGRTIVRMEEPADSIRIEVNATPNPVAPGGVVHLTATLSGAAADDVELAWDVPEGWSLELEPHGRSGRLTAPARAQEPAWMRVRVRDGRQAARAEVPIRVAAQVEGHVGG